MHTARILIILLAAASITGCPERPGTKKDSSRAGAKKDGKKAEKKAEKKASVSKAAPEKKAK